MENILILDNYYLINFLCKNKNIAYHQLLNQHELVKQVIEDVVKFQHGALNNTVDTMGDVITGYSRHV